MNKFWKSGDPFVWLTGSALAFCLLLIAGLIVIILVNGLRQFWPSDVEEIRLIDGGTVLGEVWNRERIPSEGDEMHGVEEAYRIRVKTGNRDVYDLDFRWIDEAEIEERATPADVIALERWEWGNFYGYFRELREGSEVIATDLGEAWSEIVRGLKEMEDLHRRIEAIEVDEIGEINYYLEAARLEIRHHALESDTTRADVHAEVARIQDRIADLEAEYGEKEKELAALYKVSRRYAIDMVTADGREKTIRLFDVVRIYRPNRMDVVEKSCFYAGKVREFVSGDPRESNTEGGIFPAIFGTVMLVMIMSLAVVPLGVLAAVYLREYARQGPWVRSIRIAVNNLAGVPSIVYGIFGLGFFVYAIGGTIDKIFFPEALPTPTYGTGGILWASLTLALMTVPVVIVAAEEGLATVPQEIREGSVALAATKFETLWRIVIPGAMPGILTGLILAIARAAGEVAPLMITGVVKLAPALPMDRYFPYIHLERKFMHLGFHIYDVGFQSPNVEAAIPMVYSTTLLLLMVVLLLNVVAIIVRNRLRKRTTYAIF